MAGRSSPTQSRFASFLPPLALAVLTLAGVLAATIQPPQSGPVAMVFPPWWTPARAVTAASVAGPVLALGAVPFVVIVAPANARGRAALGRAGAWLLLDPILVPGCLSFPDRT